MTDIVTGALGSVSPIGEPRDKNPAHDGPPQGKKRRPPSAPPPATPTTPEADDTEHQIDELA
jgi:hypothetical protein